MTRAPLSINANLTFFSEGLCFYLFVGVHLVLLQIDAFQHMQHFVQGMQQQAQHAIAAEDQQHKLELHKLMARSAPVHAQKHQCFHRKYFHLYV